MNNLEDKKDLCCQEQDCDGIESCDCQGICTCAPVEIDFELEEDDCDNCCCGDDDDEDDECDEDDLGCDQE